MGSQILRIGVGGCTQVTAYDCAKSVIAHRQWSFPDERIPQALCALFAAVAVVVVATPADVIASRMYVVWLHGGNFSLSTIAWLVVAQVHQRRAAVHRDHGLRVQDRAHRGPVGALEGKRAAIRTHSTPYRVNVCVV